MAKAPPKKTVSHPEAKGLALIAFSLFAGLCLLSFNTGTASANWLGLLGHGLAFGLSYLFGLLSFFVIGFLLWTGWKLLSEESIPAFKSRALYFSLFLFSASLLLNLLSEVGFPFPDTLLKKIYNQSIFFEDPYPHRYIRHNVGGVPAYFLYKDLPSLNFERLFSNVGIAITFSITLFTSLLLSSQKKIFPLIQNMLQRYSHWKEDKLAELEEQESKKIPLTPYPPSFGLPRPELKKESLFTSLPKAPVQKTIEKAPLEEPPLLHIKEPPPPQYSPRKSPIQKRSGYSSPARLQWRLSKIRSSSPLSSCQSCQSGSAFS